MSDGGVFAWKRQEVDESRGPAADFSNLQSPLPDPPKDSRWVRDEKTREWRLEPKRPGPGGGEAVMAEAKLVDEGSSKKEEVVHVHEITPSDTFQGLCLRYKITPTRLRQFNGGFSGTNLNLAPNPLRIPSTEDIAPAVAVPVGVDTNADKLRKLLKACPRLSLSEAKCYLELNDWDRSEALANARLDGF